MKKRVFTGCATALITPFCAGGIDYDALERMIERQISAGVSALVFAGTTGEAATLSNEEWKDLCRFAKNTVKDRTKVIAGCGSNSTEAASKKASCAEDVGADALLVVTPYYNKASREGMIRHYETVCRACAIPVIAYNVPSRTGCDLDIGICREIAEIENIAGIKEASGSASRAASLVSEFGDDFPVYSGCDEINLPVLSVGGAGIISVLSNVFPEECVKMCRAAAKGDGQTALRLYLAMYSFSRALFCEVNPIPVKTVMARLGMCEERFRLPMCKISEENGEALMREYRKLCEKL